MEMTPLWRVQLLLGKGAFFFVDDDDDDAGHQSFDLFPPTNKTPVMRGTSEVFYVG